MNENRKRIGMVSLLLTIAYVCIIIYFLLFADRLGRGAGYETYRYNIRPLEEIRRFIVYRQAVPDGAVILNLLGNLIVFFPLGFLIPIWTERKMRFVSILLLSFAFSLVIETIQLVSKVGVFDVDDLLLNTIGGILGWICCQIVWRQYRRIVIDRKNKKGNSL